MNNLLVPAPLRSTLGESASENLVEMFAAYHEFSTERFERRLAQEIGGLRLEMHQGLAGVRQDMAQLENRLLKWSFLFWIGQMAVITGLLSYFVR